MLRRKLNVRISILGLGSLGLRHLKNLACVEHLKIGVYGSQKNNYDVAKSVNDDYVSEVNDFVRFIEGCAPNNCNLDQEIKVLNHITEIKNRCHYA